jgi:hypothetical protein
VEDVKRVSSRHKDRLFRSGIAAIALCAGIAGAPVQGIAWADSPASGSTSSGTADAGPAANGSARRADSDKPITSHRAKKDDAPATNSLAGAKDPIERDRPGVRRADPDPDTDIRDAEDNEPSDTEAPAEVAVGDAVDPVAPTDAITDEPAIPELVVVEPDSPDGQDSAPEEEPVGEKLTVSPPVAQLSRAVGRQDSAAVPTLASPAELMTVKVPSAQRGPARLAAAAQTGGATALAAVTSPSTVETTTPSPPKPLSPIAELLELPGRLVNAVLQVFDFTSSADSPRIPNGLGPINDLIFGAFRELERLLGLQRTPAPQPVVPALTYTGPLTRPTPTVAQFLNASAAGYVLGSTPGGLVPFTVNGFQMSSTNIFSGMVGDVWVTPQGQMIIAYQGTTGGSHLLFNPIITVSQVLADLQVVFTRTTPLAFYDALDFAERVQAEAALQGYSSDDIFVTGHSLGGWEAQFVAQQTGLAGIGFEAPGINTIVPGNGADSMFVNIGTYGSSAPYMSTDLPGLQPFMPPFVPGGGSKPHFGPIVMIGDPAAMTPLYNASTLWGKSLVGSVVFLVDYLMNFFQYHLPGVQAYHLDVTPDPGVVLWLGTVRGPVHTGYGTLTIPELMKAASDDGILFTP